MSKGGEKKMLSYEDYDDCDPSDDDEDFPSCNPERDICGPDCWPECAPEDMGIDFCDPTLVEQII